MLSDCKKNSAKRCLKLRNKLQLTQQEAADLFGIHITSWQDWEYGVSLPNSEHSQLLEYYETNPLKTPTIAQMCEFIRKRLGLRKMDMAKMFDVQLNTWGYWERGVMKPIGENREKIQKTFLELEDQEDLAKAS